MAILASYDDADNAVNKYVAWGPIDGVSTRAQAQGFKVSVGADLTLIQLRLVKLGSPGTIILQVRNVSGGAPGSTVYATATANGNAITATTTPGELVAFTFSIPYYALVADTQYCWVLWCPDGDTDTNYVRPLGDNDGSQYTDGVLYLTANGGSSWAARSGEENMFIVGGTLTAAADPPTTDRSFNKKLIAVGSNTLFYESASALTELAASQSDINCLNLLQICGAYQKVFIANEAKLKVADFGNIKLTVTDIANGSRIPVKGDLLTGSSSSAQMVVDFVTASTGAAYIYGQRVTPATFVAADNNITSADSEVDVNIDVVETAGTHWYNWTVFAALADTYGSLPDFASLICLYRGRVVISGNKE